MQKTFDICYEAKQADADVQCPVEPGDYLVKHTVKLPKEIPPGKRQTISAMLSGLLTVL